MKAVQTNIPGALIFESKIFADDRGYFFESFNAEEFEKLIGKQVSFVQDNQSFSTYGVIRGLHFQKPPFAQAKLVRVICGRILDVAVDIRHGSPTFGKHIAVELSEDNKRQLYIPKGFAHGFSVLSASAVVLYKCDAPYSPEYDCGICYNDPTLGIDWQIPHAEAVVSDKDKKHGFLSNASSFFSYGDE